MRNLNYKHLHYFWTVAHEGGVTAAARRLFVTPQTISGQVGALEDQIGEPLFARAGRSLQLTAAGRIVFEYADEIFRLGAELHRALNGKSPAAAPEFSIGIVPGISKRVACRILQPALNPGRCPHVICHGCRPEDLVGQMARLKLDMVLADRPAADGEGATLSSHLLGGSGFSFFAHPRLLKLKPRDFPASLDGTPMFLPGAGSPLRQAMETWFEEQNVAPSIAGEIDDSALTEGFAQAGAGVVAAPSIIACEVVSRYRLSILGTTEAVRESYYAISAERCLKHPAVIAIREAARGQLFAKR